ncbi:MAG: IS110 family transposase, partial [Tannerellaceae bacterium]|nr:IS110 family transposase [Tannerellaceae bacterium]
MKRYCGLDVHKSSVFMCILDENGVIKERQFTTLTSDLYELRTCLKQNDVFQVAMESTSIYWIPIWRVLCEEFD